MSSSMRRDVALKNEKIVMTRTEIENRIQQLDEIILQATSMLYQEDYKVIKCYESSLKGESIPYDLEELLSRRDNLRNNINRAQEEIEELRSVEPEEEPMDFTEPQINDETL